MLTLLCPCFLDFEVLQCLRIKDGAETEEMNKNDDLTVFITTTTPYLSDTDQPTETSTQTILVETVDKPQKSYVENLLLYKLKRIKETYKNIRKYFTLY